MTTPLITFKAGQCEYNAEAGATVKPDPTPGYIYITQDDDLHHFCWRPRSAPHTEPTLDLLMLPTDATFTPYQPKDVKTAVRGRVYVLKFSSSSVKHFFWLQAGPSNTNDPSSFSARDLKIGEIVNAILQGEEIDVSTELRELPSNGRDEDDDDEDDEDDDDTAMEDVDGPGSGAGGGSIRRAASGGAGAGATGGDVRRDGEDAREGGANGGRASQQQQSQSSLPSTSTDPTQAAIANFLRSLGGSNLPTSSSPSAPTPQGDQIFTTLSDLLPTTTTIPILPHLPSSTLDTLLSHLPPQILLTSTSDTESDLLADLNLEGDEIPDAETIQAITLSLPDSQKQAILARILRTPQFSQALASLTHALRDGGLPAVSEGLGLKVKGGGFLNGNGHGNVPMGGGMAVRAFVEAYRDRVLEEDQEQGKGQGTGTGEGSGNSGGAGVDDTEMKD